MVTVATIDCDHDGQVLAGYIALPDADGPRPGVLVMHDAYGLGDHVRGVIARLAELGYVAVAGNMYNGDRDVALAGARMTALHENPHTLRDRMRAWHATLKGRSETDPARTAATGYCFGGQCVLELARSGADVQAVVSYHGLLTTALPIAPGAITGKVVVYTGALDPYAPPEHVAGLEAEMRSAGASWQITTFGDAYHAFTNPDEAASSRPGLGYDAVADAISWAGTVALLQLTLGNGEFRATTHLV